MKTKIALDIKSLVIGAAATALIVFATAASTQSPGRYQLCIGGNGTAGVIDTSTGQVWTAVIGEHDGQATGNIGRNTFLTPKDG